MRKNLYTIITGSEVVLVSYKKEHVAKYHEWMKSDELKKFTASEPLTLYEEYKMQSSWLNDDDKCTYIVLDKATYWETKDEIDAMIGDTNLFFPDPDNPHLAEAEIMIAEESFRGQKRGWEAMLLMLHYGISELKVTKYQVKIGEDNEKSINMFKKMDFEFSDKSEAFKEVTYVKNVTPQWKNWIEMNVNFIKIRNCDIRVISALSAQRKAAQLALKEKEKKEKEQKENDDNDKKEGDGDGDGEGDGDKDKEEEKDEEKDKE